MGNNRHKTPVQKTCVDCGSIYEAIMKDAKFCKPCRNKVRLSKISQKPKAIINVECTVCKNLIRDARKSQKYCQDCKQEAYKKVKKEKALATKKQGVSTTITCKTCQETVTRTGANQKRCSYCSNIRNYRRIAFENLLPICNRCDSRVTVKTSNVHHKDRDRKNDSLSNLEILCISCHRDEHTRRDRLGRLYSI